MTQKLDLLAKVCEEVLLTWQEQSIFMPYTFYALHAFHKWTLELPVVDQFCTIHNISFELGTTFF